MRSATIVLGMVVAAVPALAGQPVHEVRPASRGGMVRVENVSGSIRVTGWDRAEVAVDGELGRGAERLDVTGSGQRVSVRVVLPRDCRRCEGSVLELRVPVDSRLEVESVSAEVRVSDVNGVLLLQSVSGGILVRGEPREVDARSVSGEVDVEAAGAAIRARSVSGDVTVRGARGHVEAGSVSGSLLVEGEHIERADLGTTSGDIRFGATLAPTARLEASSVSGEIELRLPRNVDADFEVSSFSGSIENDFGPRAQRVSKYTSEKELSFRSGSGGARVVARSFSGAVLLIEDSRR